jgi:hypothetical protein
VKLSWRLVGAIGVLAIACSSGSGPASPGAAPGGPSDDDASAPPPPDAGDSDAGNPPPDDASPPPDSGGADSGVPCSDAQYCDGFETYGGTVADGQTLGPWTASVTGATMQIDATKAYKGSKSLRITAAAQTGPGTHGTLKQSVTKGLVAGNDVYGRAMVFYSKTGGNDLPLAVHSWLFNATGRSSEADGGVDMNMGGGGAKMQLNYHPPPPLPEQSVQGGAITAGAWHCVQWQYDGSGTPVHDQGKVWVDGKPAVDVPASKGWKLATPWDAFAFGFTHYQTLGNGVDVYLDEFALGDAMIACP